MGSSSATSVGSCPRTGCKSTCPCSRGPVSRVLRSILLSALATSVGCFSHCCLCFHFPFHDDHHVDPSLRPNDVTEQSCRNRQKFCPSSIGLVLMRSVLLLRQPIRYNPLGLHHAAGSLPLAMALQTGCAVVLAGRFSASNYMRECVETGATVGIYIGEMLRYLVNSATTPFDLEHSLRLLQGNGLRADVWARLQDRFGISSDAVRYYPLHSSLRSAFFHSYRLDLSELF